LEKQFEIFHVSAVA